ncbi:MAG: phosphomannomutase/phosphoglucomutase [Rickettsiales bacterium]
MIEDEIVREYDVRGVYKKNLTPETAEHIGAALCGYLKKHNLNGKIAICCDGRHSSPTLSKSLMKGIIESGRDVLDIGLGPTPLLYFSNFVCDDVIAGVMITGSHNPPEYNGFKFIVNKKPFYGQDLKDVFLKKVSIDSSVLPGKQIRKSLSDEYIEFLVKTFSVISNRTVVWDCGNGATGEIIEELCKNLKGRHVVLNGKIDGNFPSHHPDPAEEKNLLEIINKVKEIDADFGIAFDGDGDRLGIVDKKGTIVWGDQILAILAQDLLKDNPGAPIIADVKSSKVLFDIIDESGGGSVIWKTGHSNIKTKMIELNSPLAGEMSGHIFYKDGYYGYDDAIYAAIRFMNCFDKNPQCISYVVDRFSKVVSTPEIRVQCDEDKKFVVVDLMKRDLGDKGIDYTDTDGIRVDREEGWWLIRASNTQDILVVRVEGQTSRNFENLKNECKDLLHKHGLILPVGF